MRTAKNYGGLDRFRIAAAVLVIAIHTSPLTLIGDGADFFLTRVLARIAVPFFFMVTGQFAAADFMPPADGCTKVLFKYLKKTALLYAFCILLYLPIGIYAGHYKDITPGAALRMLIFDGTFYHLWYFPACILGILLVYLMSQFLSLRAMTIVSGILYMIGLLGDSYFGLVQKVPALEKIYEFIFNISSYTRNGIFLAPLFLVMGMWMAKGNGGADNPHIQDGAGRLGILAPVGLAASFLIMTGEAFVLRHFEWQRHDSMYLALVPTMFFLYQCLLRIDMSPAKELRTASAWMYILHPAFIVVVRAMGKLLHLTPLLVDNSIVHYLAVTLLSAAAGFAIFFIQLKFMPRLFATPDAGQNGQKAGRFSKADMEMSADCSDYRAWIEIDQAALEQNAFFLKSRLPEKCRLMPTVKAEAYGHGAVIISRMLHRMGIDSLCVACISEGIALRKAGLTGQILILGYTPPGDFPLLVRHQLTQTVVDFDYALLLAQFNGTIHVQIGIDTGMHRLGIRCENLEEIMEVYKMENLAVDGLFTHLSATDSPHPKDRSFTDSQVRAFYQVVDILESNGYACGKLHLLASYGILNLLPDQNRQNISARQSPQEHGIRNTVELAADYVRPGIALYGILSTEADSAVWRRYLKPVLSLKARVASVRTLYAGEAAGYGLAYTAEEDMLVATISIGYADGFPRELSHGKGYVLITGHKAPVIGRVCMDQTIVDATDIPNIQPGDTAVIIGKSGGLEITAGCLAEQCGTITNEILCRLGGRLDRIIKSPKSD